MLNPTEDVVTAMIVLSGDPNWEIVVEWINENARELKEDTIHNVPDPADINYSVRYNMRRGMAISLDVLYNIMENPEGTLNEMRQANTPVDSLLEGGAL